ncbi:DUF3095 family protein [Rhizobium leguminosarum]|uniref:DUF3095 family protein n=1 Tax=Rhizobium leguminosarum TaxID=384 RepID=UPI0028F4136C|nr:DUF3095 family protein [Rhizobium leguminosarum]
MKDIRAAGSDVRTARFSASKSATYAMFAGGGLNWADRQIKAGNYALSSNSTYSAPNLDGLTCEWAPIPSQSGEILSLLIEPVDHARSAMFASLAKQIVAVFDEGARRSHPVPSDVVITEDVAEYLGDADWADVVSNSDYRRYDDVLRLTLDCTSHQIELVEALLIRARSRGDIKFGLHRQTHALMTCLVPSSNKRSHLHFLDGMGGGYTKAAEMLR